MQYIKDHWGQILAIIGAVATGLATLRNLLTHLGVISPKTSGRLGKAADLLAWISEHGKDGVIGILSFPGFRSRSPGEGGGGGAALLLPLAFLLAMSCAGARQLLVDSATCVLGQVPGATADVVDQALASMTSDPGAPSWDTFASTTLVARGIKAAICIVESALAKLDNKLPTAVAELEGHVLPLCLADVAEGASCPDPKLYLAHERAVSFLERHGVRHRCHPRAHGAATH